MNPPALCELHIADDTACWRDIGFDISDGLCQIGTTTLRFVEAGERAGLTGWTLSGRGPTSLDGIPTSFASGEVDRARPTEHPNGSTSIDHVVVTTPDLARTAEALADAGFDLKRVRDVPGGREPRQQMFYRMGEVILEVVGPTTPTGTGKASLWGLVVVVPDIASAGLGDRLGRTKNAVQPGRQIATVAKAAGLAVPLALITQ